MGRKCEFAKVVVQSVRFEEELWCLIMDLAQLETIRTGKLVTASQLVREACSYTYQDNDRLRECFRRSRSGSVKRF